jgi:O-antigen/teichoic acid export membrane protein
MGIIKRQGIQNSIVSYAGVLIGYINVMVLFPLVLEVEEVGLTRLLPYIAVFLAQLSALGFANAGIKYFPFFRDKTQGHHNFLLIFLGVPLVGFLAITAVYLLFEPGILDYFGKEDQLVRQYSFYIIPLSLFTLLFNLFNAYLTSLYKTVVPSLAKDLLLRLGTSACVLLYYYEVVDFPGFLFLFIGVNCGMALVLLFYIFWLKQFHFSLQTALLQDKPILPMVRYGLYAFMGNLSSVIIIMVDSFMIGHYQDLGAVGVYTTAANVASIILIAGSSIFKIALPRIADYWKAGDMDGMQKLYQQVTRINLVVGGLLYIGICANLDNLFALLPPEYRAGRYVILFICTARLIDLATGINGHILITSPRYRLDLVFNILLSGLTIAANTYFIPRYGISGAAFVFMSVYAIINTMRVICVWIFYRMQPFNFSSIKVAAVGLGAYACGAVLPYVVNTWLDILVRSVLITGVFGAGVLAFNLAPELTDKFTAYFQPSKKQH